MQKIRISQIKYYMDTHIKKEQSNNSTTTPSDPSDSGEKISCLENHNLHAYSYKYTKTSSYKCRLIKP